jgi:hypothetical protein
MVESIGSHLLMPVSEQAHITAASTQAYIVGVSE